MRAQRFAVGVAAFLGLVSVVFLANWLIVHYGVVPVGFGLTAPAGVYAASLGLVFRDLVQNTLGKWAAVGAILAGAAMSLLVSEHFAMASAAAFLASEAADFAIYTALYRRAWVPAVIPAAAVGIVIDSVLFLWLAFGSEAFLAGQIVGKGWAVLAAVAFLVPVRRAYAVRPA